MMSETSRGEGTNVGDVDLTRPRTWGTATTVTTTRGHTSTVTTDGWYRETRFGLTILPKLD
jgi:hypothetical protein